MSETTIIKAKKLLTEGKVLVLRVGRLDMGVATGEFAVQGSAPDPYIVRSYHTDWECSCPARVVCAHIEACKLIYKSTADAVRLFGGDEFDSLFQKKSPEDFEYEQF